MQPYLDPQVYRRFVEYCAATGTTESAVVNTALQQFLDQASDSTLLFRRLDRLGRAEERTQRDIAVLSEAFGAFVQFWFAHTSAIAADARDSARRNSASRYKQFVDYVAERFGRGHRFIDDLPKEPLADDAELEAVVRTADAQDAPPPSLKENQDRRPTGDD